MNANLGAPRGIMVESGVRFSFDPVPVQIHYRSYLGRVGGVRAEGIRRSENFPFPILEESVRMPEAPTKKQCVSV